MRSFECVHNAVRVKGAQEGDPMSLLHRARQALQPRAFFAVTDDIEHYGLVPGKCPIERSQQKLHILAWAQHRNTYEAKRVRVSGMRRR